MTQDTFIEILDKINDLKEAAAFVTWSKQIAYHKCTAYFRKRKELLADENEDGYSVFDTIVEDREEFIPDEALDKEDLKQTIHAMIDNLPEEQRSAILLRYFDEISVKEIAEIQGVTEGTVKSRLNYGRKAIKQSVEAYEKKNNIKLRCVGVVPLLLWLFREERIAKGSAFAVKTAKAASKLSKPFVGTTMNGSKAVTVAVKAGATITKTLATKVIAGVVAAAIVVGGAAAGMATRNNAVDAAKVENDTAVITNIDNNETGMRENVVADSLHNTAVGCCFADYVPDNVTKIIFTNIKVPDGVATIDVSESQNGSVVSWVTTAATCAQTGIETYTCLCGDSYTEKIDKISHNYKDVVIDPACSSQGYTTHTCTGCGDSYKDTYGGGTWLFYLCKQKL